MSELSSKNVEQKILALMFKDPTYIRALTIKPDLFAFHENRDLFSLIKKFVVKYKAMPTKDTLVGYANTLSEDQEDLEGYAASIELLDALPTVEASEANYYFEKATNLYDGRELCKVHDILTERIQEHGADFTEVRREIMKQIIASGSNDMMVKRGPIYSTVKERWDENIAADAGLSTDIIPFGIKSLDDVVHGMKKTFLTMFYSKVGGGKTTLAVNVAYNAAKAGHKVLYLSLEMSFNLLAAKIDGLMGKINTEKIIFGGLSREEKKRYKAVLKKQAKEKLNIEIADIAMNATTASLHEEIETYKATHGCYPDLVVIDYANLMEPSKDYSGTSQRFDNLFSEFHGIAKYYNIGILTMMQESRSASMDEIKKNNKNKKERENTDGLHNIGQSNYAAPHCETVIRIQQNESQLLTNTVMTTVDKNRYGACNRKIPLFSAWEYSYIGDKKSNIKIQKAA